MIILPENSSPLNCSRINCLPVNKYTIINSKIQDIIYLFTKNTKSSHASARIRSASSRCLASLLQAMLQLESAPLLLAVWLHCFKPCFSSNPLRFFSLFGFAKYIKTKERTELNASILLSLFCFYMHGLVLHLFRCCKAEHVNTCFKYSLCYFE